MKQLDKIEIAKSFAPSCPYCDSDDAELKLVHRNFDGSFLFQCRRHPKVKREVELSQEGANVINGVRPYRTLAFGIFLFGCLFCLLGACSWSLFLTQNPPSGSEPIFFAKDWRIGLGIVFVVVAGIFYSIEKKSDN